MLGLGTQTVESLSGLSPWLLCLALLLHLAKMTAEARAWHGIVAASQRGAPIRFRTTLGAFVGSIGANALLPARVGEAFRVGVVRRHASRPSVAAVGGTIVLETLLELVFAALVVGVVVSTGRSVGVLGAPLRGVAGHPVVLLAAGGVLASAAMLAVGFRRRAMSVARGIGQGFSVTREPLALLRVFGWKVVAWNLRIASVFAFLVAFGLPATPWTAVLVLAAQTVAATLPFTPGGAGVQQAALVAVLAGTANASAVLGFGVGMQAATVLADVAVGSIAVAAVAGRGELLSALATLRRRRPSVVGC